MVGIDMPMPYECSDCPLMQYDPLSGLTECGSTGSMLAYNFEKIKLFEGRAIDCPLIDLTDDGK